MDCAGMISLATRACGINYRPKNTTAIKRFGTQISDMGHLQNGDIIYVPGHVLVVSDIKRNLAIEARGYGSGTGKVQELPLNTLFKGIETYADLFGIIKEKKPLTRLACDGSIQCVAQEVLAINLFSPF
jgi:cell wall-associated NlpC family hydrolase